MSCLCRKTKWARCADRVSTWVGVPAFPKREKTPRDPHDLSHETLQTTATLKNTSIKSVNTANVGAGVVKTSINSRLGAVKWLESRAENFVTQSRFCADVGQWDATHKQPASCQCATHSNYTHTRPLEIPFQFPKTKQKSKIFIHLYIFLLYHACDVFFNTK